MTQKVWDDRAERDLFLAIINIKVGGIISGADWSDIGAALRAKGYGFTNEGCRYVIHCLGQFWEVQ